MIYKKIFILSIMFALALLFLQFANAEAGYCCEKTLNGAWCQNAPQEQCDQNFKISPTSCDSTSYCKPGCCFDSQEGLCMESTPQRVCNDANSTWANSSQCKIPQCNLGCCILGDQGAFVTLSRCKQISGFYGLKTDFRTTIKDEWTCIATAQGEDKGACVTEDNVNGVKKCSFTSRSSCAVGKINNNLNVSGNGSTITGVTASVGFYKDILCSAEELGNICGPSTGTTIINGKDEVYYLDTCGNIANIYDANRYNDKQYWKKVYKKSEVCGYGTSNAGSKTCGNCDYFLGSIGKKVSGLNGLGQPNYGNYICVDLGCKAAGKRHGESWCVKDSPNGEGLDTVGSRYYKEVCLFNEVITEPCADFRNEICIEDNFNGFTEAACRVNRWQDCVQQEESADCLNKDVRDCMWVEGYYFSANSQQIEKSNNDTDKGPLTPDGLCVPNYPPGFNFWGSSQTTSSSGLGGLAKAGANGSGTPKFTATTPSFGSGLGTGYVNPTGVSGSTGQCALGNAKVSFQWVKVDRIWPYKSTSWECANDECRKYISDQTQAEISKTDGAKFAADMNSICYKLGDCGGYINWQGKYTEDGFAAYVGQERIAGSGGSKIKEADKKINSPSPAIPATGSSNTPAIPASGLSGIGQIIKDIIKEEVGES